MKLLYTLLLLLPFSISAQRWSAGILLGGSNYQGDLVETHVLPRETNLAYGAFARYNISSKISIKADVFKGMLSGSDLNFNTRINRGFSFKTDILQAGMNIEWNILGKNRFSSKGVFTKNFTPYIYTGIGAVMFKPKVYAVNLDSPYNGEQFGVFNFTIPFGGGIKYDISRSYTIGAEFATNLPFSDYMDGVSFQGTNNDWFMLGGITITKWFGVAKEKVFE
jgi:hypothetical protein